MVLNVRIEGMTEPEVTYNDTPSSIRAIINEWARCEKVEVYSEPDDKRLIMIVKGNKDND